jgi:hypothetical protein
MTKKAQRAKTPTPVSDSVVDAMEARLEQAQDHASSPAESASSTHESGLEDAPHAPQDSTHP